MIAAVYILVVLIPLLNRRHLAELPRDFMYAGLLYSLPLAAVAGASAFGWMVAYLRGPDIVAGYITGFAGTDGPMIMLLLVCVFIIVGDFIDAVPAIIIFMPIINKLTRGRRHPAAAHGRGHHHHAGLRPDHAAVRTVAAGGVEVRRRRLRQGDGALAAALRRLSRDDRVRRAVPRYRAVAAEACCCPNRSAASRSPSGTGYICP